MSLSLFDAHRQKKLRFAYLIFLISCVAFYTLIYMPLYHLMKSDEVTFGNLLILWMELVEPLMNYTFYWGSFGFVLYSILRFGARESIAMIAFYAAAAVLRYVTGIFSYLWVMGAIHWSEFVVSDLPGIALSTLVDWSQMAAVLGLAAWVCSSIRNREPALSRVGAIAKAYLPFKKLFDLQNALFWLIAATAAVPSLIRILERIYYDLDRILIRDIEIQGAGDAIVMLTYYIVDLLTPVIGAVLLPLLLKLFHRADLRAAAEEECRSADV